MLQVLDAAALRAWCAAGLEGLTAARDEIDELNVYPVPDGDTGTNLQLTMAATDEAVRQAPADLAATVAALVTGSLLGARGNSGVILSQLLRGMGEVLSPLQSAGPEDLRAALIRSAESAYAAVAAPVEGTVLTVAREAAAAARGGDLATVVRSAREAGAAALARTPDLLPALKAAGVVDAGGRGWCVLLEALERVVTGVAPLALPTLLVPRRSGAGSREAGSDLFGYEVQYLLRGATDRAVAELREVLGRLGDSLVIVGADGLHNVHVHVNDVGAAVEAGVEAGRPFQITVARFADQIADHADHADRADHADHADHAARVRPVGRVAVAVAAGAGLTKAFQEGGAVVVDGGPTANPSTSQLLAAIESAHASEVVLLPNDSNVLAVAHAAADQARASGLSVAVVPTRSVVQGLSALSVTDPARPFNDDVAAMAQAAGATRWAELTSAVKDAQTPVGPCRSGDVLGLLDGSVVRVGGDVDEVARDLLGRLLEAGGELVTVVVGSCADPQVGRRLEAWLSDRHPSLAVVVLQGDQPHYPLLLGVE